MTPALPQLLAKGTMKLLGWVGDETPWQYGAIVTSKRNADRPELIAHFLNAFRRGAKDYHDAFAGPDGSRRDGPEAPLILKIVAKYTGLTEGGVKLGVTYADAQGRLDIKDVRHQIDWYRAHGFIKGEVNADAIIDPRYVKDLPSH
jgi:NitT/TauT family transport system substrate-binding protein